MRLNEFFNWIDKREYIPGIYIVRLQYKFVYENKTCISNEILQYDPGYAGNHDDPRYPWYHDCWLWYTDWYMCVDPSSIEVLRFTTLDEIFDGNRCGTCKHASIHCTEYGMAVDAFDGCSNWEGEI